jgi:hypothetical protein
MAIKNCYSATINVYIYFLVSIKIILVKALMPLCLFEVPVFNTSSIELMSTLLYNTFVLLNIVIVSISMWRRPQKYFSNHEELSLLTFSMQLLGKFILPIGMKIRN